MTSLQSNSLLGYEFETTRVTYTSRDIILYALGVGLIAHPESQESSKYLYESHPEGLRVLPTFSAAIGFDFLPKIPSLPGVDIDWPNILHGFHQTIIHHEMPSEGTVVNRARIAELWDKGSGVVMNVVVQTSSENGTLFAENQYGLFLRGIGGYGGDRGPRSEAAPPQDRKPDWQVATPTPAQLAMLYRLSGDMNPLHADPAVARAGEFHRPILHGLCTLGIAVVAILQAACNNEPGEIQKISARFNQPFYPGETLKTHIWSDSQQLAFTSFGDSSSDPVLVAGRVHLREPLKPS